jgi:thiol-disulfide isomerase/thioredoxin
MNAKRQLILALGLALAALAPAGARADTDVVPNPEAEAQAPAFTIGQPAPQQDVRMKGVSGTDVSIAEAAGAKGTLVIFTCNHCPWVKMWQTRIAQIGNAAVKRGVGVIAVNANDPAAYPEDGITEMKARAKKLGFKFPYVVDGTSDVARAFGATHTPEAYLLDAQGNLIYHGGVDDNARDEKAVKQAWLRDAVDALVTGKPVPLAETKALGCGIKYREKSSS